MGVTQQLAEFAGTITFDDLPAHVVRETRRLVLDSIGCALGGSLTRKGRLALRVARNIGGRADARVLGGRLRVAAGAAAYANAELMNALDFDVLLGPPDHATPYVLPLLLTTAEKVRATGRELLLAAAIAHETATRISLGMAFGRRFEVQVGETGPSLALPTPGYGHCLLAAVAGAGSLLQWDAARIADGLGIAGYATPVPMLMKFAMTAPVSDPKYLSPGMLAQTGQLALAAAAEGSRGDGEVLDGPYGLWRAFGADAWHPEAVEEGLGRVWHFPERLFYKPFPCCGAIQYALRQFARLLAGHSLGAADITAVRVRQNALADLPAWDQPAVADHVDTQFNVPYVFAAVAHGLPAGPAWQTAAAYRAPAMVAFMRRVRVLTPLRQGWTAGPAVEVTVGRGSLTRTVRAEEEASWPTMSDADLCVKFRRNARPALSERQIARLLDLLQHLPDVADVADLLDACCGDANGQGA